MAKSTDKHEIPAEWAHKSLMDLEFIERAKKAGDAVEAYLAKLSELDTQNMKATVAMFSLVEMEALANEPKIPEAKKAFLIVAQFLKRMQNAPK